MYSQAQPQDAFFKRNARETMSECFAIYGKHILKIIVIAAIVQAPVSVVEIAISGLMPTIEDLQELQAGLITEPSTEQASDAQPAQLPSGSFLRFVPPILGYFTIIVTAYTFLSGAIAYAVGIQYLTGGISILTVCVRAWWRVLSLVTLSVVFAAMSLLMLTGFASLIIPGILVMALITYFSMAVPAAVIEGYRPIAAIKRSFALVQSNWWLTFRTWVLAFIVSLGMYVLIVLILSVLPLGTQPSDSFLNMGAVLTNFIVGALVSPIMAITGALVYFNLRQRKDDYTLQSLSQELRIPRADHI